LIFRINLRARKIRNGWQLGGFFFAFLVWVFSFRGYLSSKLSLDVMRFPIMTIQDFFLKISAMAFIRCGTLIGFKGYPMISF